MSRRATTRRFAVTVASLSCLALVACTSDKEGAASKPAAAVDGAGPDLADVSDADGLVSALEDYTGPYRIEADVDFAGGRTEIITFDGERWATVVDPGAPVDEFRWISDGTTAACYQLIDGEWTTSAALTDLAERRLSSNMDNWTVFQYLDGTNERPLADVVEFETTADGMALTAITAPDDYVSRIEFVVADGVLTGTRQYLADGSLRSTQEIAYSDVAEISTPDDATDGTDVLC